jgi:cytochrome c biogenesis protein CcdA
MDWSFLLLILSSGLFDGLDVFTLGIFAGFLMINYARNSRDAVRRAGILLILMIFATYFTLGLGLIQVLEPVVPYTPYVALIGAGIMILFGLLNIRTYLSPGSGPTLRWTEWGVSSIRGLFEKPAGWATVAAGILIGLHSFPCPCTFVYPTILSLLTRYSLSETLLYLLGYNAMFVAPLVVMLAVASNESVAARIDEWKCDSKQRIRLAFGSAMIVIAFAIIFFALQAMKGALV